MAMPDPLSQPLSADDIRALAHSRIARLRVGDKVRVAAGEVVRVRRHEYCLNADYNVRVRNRWGTLPEILADVDYFLATGLLPQPVSRSF